MTKRLFQAVMLIAALSLVLPATTEATTIPMGTMSFSPGTNQSDLVKIPGATTGYDFRLTFLQVDTAFTVDVTADDNPNLSSLPPGYVCVPINGGTNCIMFTATPSSQGWTGGFLISIAWNFNTDPLYPNTPVDQNNLGRIRIVHISGSGVTDITTTGAYCTTCGVDPGISGQADNFSSFIVAQAPSTAAVPEPGSLLLLGTGVSALVLGWRRRNQKR